MKVIHIPVPHDHMTKRPHGLLDVTTVVLHHTATPTSVTAQDIAEYFAKPTTRVNSHEVIGRAGVVVRCVPWDYRAWHAGRSRFDDDHNGKYDANDYDVNDFSIGIEICNLGNNKDPFPDAQIRAVAADIREMERFCQNLRLRNITDHEAVSLEGKIDLQRNFPAAKLFWWLIHPNHKVPKNVYDALPDWAQHRCKQIWK